MIWIKGEIQRNEILTTTRWINVEVYWTIECNKCCMANAFLANLGHLVFKVF